MPPPGARLLVTAPSSAVIRRPVSVLVEAVDADGRTIPDFAGAVSFSCSDPLARLPAPWEFYSIERGRRRFEGLAFRCEGVYTVTAVDEQHGLRGESAPILVELRQPKHQLFWGDLHGHSGAYACGVGSIDAYYQFARDTAGLDFCALTDHDQLPGLEHDLSAAWPEITAAAKHYHRPLEFVTFLGFEWTSMAPQRNGLGYGHKNVYYLDDAGPLLSCVGYRTQHPEGLWKGLKGHAAMAIPHHPAASADFRTDWAHHNEEYERLVEVYSCWGSSECAAGNRFPIRHGGGESPGHHVVDALERGYTLGLIGGGDTHDGCPGRGWAHAPRSEKERQRWQGIYPAGLQGVWAQELTRESLWQAMWVRRTYATTGARIVLEFGIDSAPMGSILKTWPGGAAHFHARIEGTADIVRAEIVRNGEVVETRRGHGRSLSFAWARTAQPGMSQYFYLRVVQVDGHMAWSSPIWLG